VSLVSLVTALRWGTIAGGIIWAVASSMHSSVFFSALVLVAYAMYRSFRSLDYSRQGWRGLISIFVELGLTTFVVVSTGYWDSPFIFSLFIPVIAAGFGRGFGHSLRIGITEALAVGLAANAVGIHSGLRLIDWCGELLLTAIAYSCGEIARAQYVATYSAARCQQFVGKPESCSQ
jgi:hypothetical protein